MAQRAELDFRGWRLTVAPDGRRYGWWVVSPFTAADHKIIKHDTCPSFDTAVHEAHRTLQSLVAQPVPLPTVLETP
jgi:hypothetical protein